MKFAFSLSALGVLLLNSCQFIPGYQNQNAAADPYATGAGYSQPAYAQQGYAPPQQSGYPAQNPYPQQGYGSPTYDVSGEKAQVYPANNASSSAYSDATAPDGPSTKYLASSSSKPSGNKPRKRASSFAASSNAGGNGGRTYVVQKGDTLSKISKARGTTVGKIMKANGLTSDVIRVGQTLKY